MKEIYEMAKHMAMVSTSILIRQNMKVNEKMIFKTDLASKHGQTVQNFKDIMNKVKRVVKDALNE